MAIGVRPVDGLIHRLLQQNAAPAVVVDRQESAAKVKHDHVSISSGAQDRQSGGASAAPAELQANPGEKALESHLLNLYRSNDKFGG